ncbi:hypothetical protein MKMG_00149 [Methanogenium sp. MK-MG]|nr:hypothetical protein MKMG_00149 [Methanogenium sp. MK-MG]
MWHVTRHAIIIHISMNAYKNLLSYAYKYFHIDYRNDVVAKDYIVNCPRLNSWTSCLSSL